MEGFFYYLAYAVKFAVHGNSQRLKAFSRWVTSPNAVKYKLKGGFCFNEADFIDYLNEYIFPDEKSTFVKSLGWTDLGRDIPEEYQGLPYFNF